MKTLVPGKRARAYVRVSHVGKSRQTTLLSDAMQLDEARRYAQFEGFSFDEENSRLFADLDVSGFRKPWRQRPGLMQHYAAAERGELDVLIFYKISRLGRNIREALDMIDAFEKLGVTFHFVADRVDSSNAQGRFVRNVLLSASEMQSEDASTFLKSTFERRARDGKLHGGALPCWLKRSEVAAAMPVLVADQVRAIRRLVELRLAGKGYVRIAELLNREGFRTIKNRYWTHGSTFKYLQESYIKSMLGIGFYGRGTPDAVELPGAYPAILTEDEAAELIEIQKLYSEEYSRKPVGRLDWMLNRRKNGRYSASSIHLLSSIVFCPYCGARMVASVRCDNENRSTPFSYRCPNYRTRSDIHIKSLCSVNALALEDAVLRVLKGELICPPPPKEKKPFPTEDAEPIRALQLKIDRLLELHLDGRIDDEDFERSYQALRLDKELLVERVSTDDSKRLKKIADLSGREDLERSELRQLLLLLVERVEAPIVIPSVTIRDDRKTLRRVARIYLRTPLSSGSTTFLAPIYLGRCSAPRCYVSDSLSEEEIKNALTIRRDRKRGKF